MIAPRRYAAALIMSMIVLAGMTGGTCFAQITAPEEYLGFKPGADFHLAIYEQGIGYFELLASQTGRMQIFDMGPTSQGRRMKYAVISSEKNMAQLDRYKEISRRLSLPWDFIDAEPSGSPPENEARRLAETGKAVVWIDGGLHATEVAPAQHLIQLAYDLVTGDDPQTRFIRENVIAILVYANPDGMTMVSDWYTGNIGTPYEVSPMPWLYHKYAGHDNNRDSFMANLVETQNMNRMSSREWFPEILYNHHQTSPFPARIWIPPDAEPTNPNVHPLVVRWKNLIGTAMGKAFDEADQPGAISRINFDSWYPGYATQVVDGHNIPSILTETGLYRYATPHFYTLDDFPENQRDLTMGVFYPSPWQGGWWRLGDAVAYCLTASKAVLDVAAKYRFELLFDKYKMGKDVIERFRKEPPYGWIIPEKQRDPNTTALMINRLILNGIEVYTADAAFEHAGISYPQGTRIIPAGQPFGLFAKNILEKQSYPDLRKYTHLWQGIVGLVKMDGDPLRPYDGAGWTLPIQMGVDYREMSTPLEVKKTPVTEAAAPAGSVTGSGAHYAFTHTDNNSFTAVNKILEAGGRVSWALSEFTLNGVTYPEGAFIADGKSISKSALRDIAAGTGIKMSGGSVRVQTAPLGNPRIALYKSWVASMDMGWITWVFDKYAFQYHLLTDAEVRAGSLRSRFDVIILPDQRASSIINGHRKGTIHPDYVGGITEGGVANLKEFVESGGILICNKSSGDLPIEQFKLPVKNILRGVPADSFSCPGSLLKVDYDSGNPVAFGMPERGMAFFSGGRVFEIVSDSTKENAGSTGKGATQEDKPPVVVAHYPDESLLLSGWLLGGERIRDKAAVLDVPFGTGRVILFGFNVHNRAQAFSTFKLLFNALYYR